MSDSLRKFVAMILLLGGLLVYCLAAMVFMADRAHWPLWIRTFAYLLLGIAWIFPCYALLTWMQTGRWRVRKDKK